MKITDVSFRRHVGKYNWADPSEEGAQIIVAFSIDGEKHSISDVVEPGSRHDYDGGDISDAVDTLSNALDRYWISTGRDKMRETIKLFWANEARIRKAYAASEAIRYQRLSAHNASLARRLLDEAMAEIEPDEQAEAA